MAIAEHSQKFTCRNQVFINTIGDYQHFLTCHHVLLTFY